jgi:type IV secretory pathway TraG/TraD family ATPase VirD4
VALFLQFEESHRETTARLWVALVAHIMRYLIVNTDRPAVLQLFDEIGNAMPIPGLIEKLNTIRSRELPTWLYWQSLEQMQKYGAKAGEGPNIILGACDFQMVFRLNDNASAEWMSQRLGVSDRLVESTSVTWGDGFIPNRTDQQSLVKEPKVFPHELQALRDAEAICVYRGQAWRGYATPYFERWPAFNKPAGERPKGDELRGAPYPKAPVAELSESLLSDSSN